MGLKKPLKKPQSDYVTWDPVSPLLIQNSEQQTREAADTDFEPWMGYFIAIQARSRPQAGVGILE